MRTSLYTVLCIVIRVGAILLAVQSVLALPAAYVAAVQWGDGGFWLEGLCACGALLLALFLWMYPNVPAGWVAGKSSQQLFESRMDAGELQYIAFAVVGLWFFFTALFDLAEMGAREAILRHVASAGNGGDMDATSRLIGFLVKDGVKMCCAAALVLGARGLVGLLRRMREAGLPAFVDDHGSDPMRDKQT